MLTLSTFFSDLLLQALEILLGDLKEKIDDGAGRVGAAALAESGDHGVCRSDATGHLTVVVDGTLSRQADQAHGPGVTRDASELLAREAHLVSVTPAVTECTPGSTQQK